jgi:hypothetical protein
MKHLKKFNQLNENINEGIKDGEVTFYAPVDDYEHSGDTDRDVKKWKSMGASTKVDQGDEDNDPGINVTISLSKDKAEKLIDKCKQSMERAERSGNYGSAIYGWDVEAVFSEFDDANKTTYVDTFKKELDEIKKLG